MKHNSPQFAFFGTPHLSVWVLEELERCGILPTLCVTAPDKPAGRSLTLTPPPVKEWALAHDIPILQPGTFKDRFSVPELANSEWDMFVVAAYHAILPEWVLSLPRKGVLNVHPSLLPKLRGPSPIRSAILHDEREAVGVSIIILDEEMDHGPILAQARVELSEWPMPGHTLDEILFREGGRLLCEVMPLWMQGEVNITHQDHEQATYTRKFTKRMGEISLQDEGYKNYLTYCAMDGWPGTYFFVGEGEKKKRVKITDAVYEGGAFIVKKVIPEGKKEMSFEDWNRNL